MYHWIDDVLAHNKGDISDASISLHTFITTPNNDDLMFGKDRDLFEKMMRVEKNPLGLIHNILEKAIPYIESSDVTDGASVWIQFYTYPQRDLLTKKTISKQPLFEWVNSASTAKLMIRPPADIKRVKAKSLPMNSLNTNKSLDLRFHSYFSEPVKDYIEDARDTAFDDCQELTLAQNMECLKELIGAHCVFYFLPASEQK